MVQPPGKSKVLTRQRYRQTDAKFVVFSPLRSEPLTGYVTPRHAPPTGGFEGVQLLEDEFHGAALHSLRQTVPQLPPCFLIVPRRPHGPGAVMSRMERPSPSGEVTA